MALSVAVLGAGVTGLVAATRFADAGFSVTVYERAKTLGAGAASWLAGGMLAPFCEAESAEVSIIEPGLSGIEWWADRDIGLKREGTLVVAPWRDQADLKRFSRRTQSHEWLDGARIAALEPDLAGRFAEGLFFAREGHLDPRMTLDRLAARLTSGEASHRAYDWERASSLTRFQRTSSSIAGAQRRGKTSRICVSCAARCSI